MDITIRQGNLAGIYAGQAADEKQATPGSSIRQRFHTWLARSSGTYSLALTDPATVRKAAEARCYLQGMF